MSMDRFSFATGISVVSPIFVLPASSPSDTTMHKTKFCRITAVLLYSLILCTSATVQAAIRPQQGAVLNYTQVLFEYDEFPGAEHYLITIQAVATSNAPLQIKNNSLAFIQYTGLQFGRQYSWYVEAFAGNKLLHKTEALFFEIAFAVQTNPLWFRSAVDISAKDGYKDGIIFLDYLGLAVNRQGEAVWYLPVHKDSLENLKMRNVKLTPGGTITYLDNTDCFEKDINGTILWKAPNDGRISGDQQEYYHHDFFKMDDGSFITSGYRYSNERNLYDTSLPCRVRYNTLIQYDQKGEVIWWWDEAKQVDKKAIWGDNGQYASEISGTHLNGVAYYKPHDAFLLSFRDNSSVLKISHRTGRILYNLGDSLRKYQPGEVPFSAQHGPSLMRNGNIVVYNNNLERSGNRGGPSYPIIKVFSQPDGKKQSSKAWEYECVSAKYPDGIRGKEGYASQLPYNNNLLVCMGGANFIFEVSPEKKVVWQCSFSRFDDQTSQWLDVNNYRCSYASSLYPCHFTVQHTKMEVGKKMAVQFNINNEGSENDSYTVAIKDDKGNTVRQLPAVSISARTNKKITVPLSSIERSKASQLFIVVRSVANNALVREVLIQP